MIIYLFNFIKFFLIFNNDGPYSWREFILDHPLPLAFLRHDDTLKKLPIFEFFIIKDSVRIEQ